MHHDGSCFARRGLLSWQQKIVARIFKNNALRRDFFDPGTFRERGSLFVFAHIDENEAVCRLAAVNVNIEMHVGQLEYTLRTQVVEGCE